MQTAELVSLPLAQRLQAMEVLWDSLCRDDAALLTIPAWHEGLLRERLTAIESGSDLVTPWEVAKPRIRQQAERVVSKHAWN